MKKMKNRNIAIISDSAGKNEVLSHVLQEQYNITEYAKLEEFSVNLKHLQLVVIIW